MRSKTAHIFSKAYGWNLFFPLFFTWKNIRLPISGKSICLKQVILTEKSEKLTKNHEKWPFLNVDGKINLRNDHLRSIGYRKHSKAFRNNVSMQSWGIMFLDWSLFELYDMVNECYLGLSRLILSLIKEGGVGCEKRYYTETVWLRFIKIALIILKKVVGRRKKSCVWKRKNCMYFTGLDPLFFLFTSGSINNTNAKYSKNFFFSLAHTENTGERAFLQFCMLGACLCFDNLEKRSLNWVIFARKGGLNLCLYSCTRQTS